MRPHRTDGVSLTFGVLFLILALWWAIAQVTSVPLTALGWLAAGGLILFGAVGLLGAIRSGRHTAAPPLPADPVDGVPPELHADIVRELLTDPATGLTVGPAIARPDGIGPQAWERRD